MTLAYDVKMKSLAAFLLAANTFVVFNHTWTVPNSSDWKIDQEDGAAVLHLVTARGPVPGPPRRPTQFALADTPDYGNVTVEAEVKPLKRSLIAVYAYRDEAHFNYAHLSTDTAAKQPVHNGIFHVFGGERVRISSQEGPAAFSAANQWYHVRLTYDSSTGMVQVAVDGKPVPALRAVDLSLRAGKIGLGSFDETADFKNVKITAPM
jgi:hypothetical protein